MKWDRDISSLVKCLEFRSTRRPLKSKSSVTRPIASGSGRKTGDSPKPGRLKVRVDGAQLPRELGQAPIDSWYFEIAGDIHLTPGEHEIKVEDTTGYFGRFSSVIVTDDMDFMPEKQVERLWRQRARVKGLTLESENPEHFDVIVAGAGPAGIPAAIAAARHGAKGRAAPFAQSARRQRER